MLGNRDTVCYRRFVAGCCIEDVGGLGWKTKLVVGILDTDIPRQKDRRRTLCPRASSEDALYTLVIMRHRRDKRLRGRVQISQQTKWGERNTAHDGEASSILLHRIFHQNQH
jgi:hypothetical protein